MPVETLCQPGMPERINEDAVFTVQESSTLTAAAIDGVTARVPAQAITSLYGDGQNGAAWAAQTTREAMLRSAPGTAPRDMLLAANDVLRTRLMSIYGALDGPSVFAREPGLAAYQNDPRMIRLALPACVVTLIQINMVAKDLIYAHAGDTSLLLFHADNRVSVASGDEGRVYSGGLFDQAKQLQRERNLPSVDDALADPEIRKRMLGGGIHLNYVDENGQPDLKRGVGAVNGLPQLAHYIQVGMADLTDVVGVLVCTDGLMWPAKPDETDIQVVNRLRGMRHLIETYGLSGYYEHLRIEERSDPDRDRYPRFKIHDDAGGVYIDLR